MQLELNIEEDNYELVLEESKTITFSLTNLDETVKRIQLSINEKEMKNIIICGISNFNIGNINPK